MKIFYIVTRADLIGGAQIHVRDLAQAMRQHGQESAIILGGQTGDFYLEQLRSLGIPFFLVDGLVREIRFVKEILAYRRIVRILKTHKPDLVSTHSSKAGILGRLAARKAGIPVLFTAHGWAFTEGVGRPKAVLYRFLEKIFGRLSQAVITVSRYDKTIAVAQRVLPPGKVYPIHNGMPDRGDEWLSDPARQPVRFLMIARFENQKDHKTLIRALAGLLQYSWTVQFIGGGAYLADCRALAARLGVLSRIGFVGQTSEVHVLMRETEVYTLISYWEGLPRSIIEAMRAGLPVVASDVGGVSELVREGENGFLIPRADYLVLRSRLQRLLTDQALRREMGAHSRALYLSHFQFERMFDQTFHLYKQILKGKKA